MCSIHYIKEYPGFTCAQTSPAYYAWMKEYNPKLYAEIKAAVKRGQWLPLVGMWVEPDLNMKHFFSLFHEYIQLSQHLVNLVSDP